MAYKILTLDGGGSWAVLEVMALAAMYGDAAVGHAVLDDFDLVAANSGGSIVLGGLLTNRALADLRDNFFLNSAKRKTVFVARGGIDIVQNVLRVGPKYDTAAKLAGLRTLLGAPGDVTLSALAGWAGHKLPAIVICTFDYDRLRGVLFRSNRASLAANFGGEIDPTLAQAIHASTDAPVNYFDAPAQFSGRQFWDGGIAGYNNPALVAVMEALANGVPAADIRVLSLGTGTALLPFDPQGALGDLGQPPRLQPRTNTLQDLLADISTLAESILDDPPDIASYHAHLALGGRVPRPGEGLPVHGPLVRMNPHIQPVPDGAGGWRVPPGISDFGALLATPIDAIEDNEVARIVELGRAWLADTVPNQPIRINRHTLECEIGAPTFDRALAVWRDLIA